MSEHVLNNDVWWNIKYPIFFIQNFQNSNQIKLYNLFDNLNLLSKFVSQGDLQCDEINNYS